MEEMKETLDGLCRELRKLLDEVEFRSKPVYTGKEVQEMFGISRPTLTKWRYQGLIGYSQVDSKIFYSPKDIAGFLDHFRYEAYEYEKLRKDSPLLRR